ncbi:MAG: membrane protein insertase YidC, partial [Melioribacteraceae bacterium]|nr:membrane protein insertase YidC [Melioribacteraceae bacterium]
MDKQTTLAFILIGVILVIWLYFNAPEPQEPPPTSGDTTLVEQNKTIQDSPEKEIAAPLTSEQPSDIIEDPGSSETGPFAAAAGDGRIITIESDLFLIEMNTKGARIRKYFLKDYKPWYFKDLSEDVSFYQKHVQLVNTGTGGDFNLVFVTKEGK